jgi:GNAT acetyltransferase-like protein
MLMQSKSKTLTLDATAQRQASASRTMTVVFIKNFEMLEDYVQAWEDLAADALAPNPFYEPWMLLPALAGLAKGSDVRVVLVLTVDQGAPILCGVFPLERTARYKGLPIAAFSLWRHIYCALCTPLIRRECARECLDAFLDWLDSERGCSLMDFNLVSGDGPFHKLLSDCLEARGQTGIVSECQNRAVLRARANADTYLNAALRRDHRKDLRRKTRRLAELGTLEFDSLEFGGDVDTWIEEFLELEVSGWKGRNGGAFACNESSRNYFTTIAKAAFARDQMNLLALRLNGKPVAMKCNFTAMPGSFAFKIAFDESYGEYSPGVLLELENIKRFHAQGRVEWMDSCAVPDHSMICRLWLDRLEIQSVLVPTGIAGKSVVAALPVIRSLNRKLRGLAARRSAGGVS